MSNMSNKSNIWIVEDDATQLDVLREYLEHLGHSVSAFSRGRDALREIQVQRPDVVLLDIYMPDMDGFELISAIRKTDYPPIIMAMSGMSGRVQMDALAIASKLGADKTFLKPFRLKELGEEIARVLK